MEIAWLGVLLILKKFRAVALFILINKKYV